MSSSAKLWAFQEQVVSQLHLTLACSSTNGTQKCVNMSLTFLLLKTGRHPCIWCTILAVEMALTKKKQGTVMTSTLQHLEEQLKDFKEKGRGDLKNAKKFFIVIHKPLLNIPVDQVRYLTLQYLPIVQRICAIFREIVHFLKKSPTFAQR